MSKYELLLKGKEKACPNCGNKKVGTVIDHDDHQEGWYCPKCNTMFEMEPLKDSK